MHELPFSLTLPTGLPTTMQAAIKPNGKGFRWETTYVLYDRWEGQRQGLHGEEFDGPTGGEGSKNFCSVRYSLGVRAECGKQPLLEIEIPIKIQPSKEKKAPVVAPPTVVNVMKRKERQGTMTIGASLTSSIQQPGDELALSYSVVNKSDREVGGVYVIKVTEEVTWVAFEYTSVKQRVLEYGPRALNFAATLAVKALNPADLAAEFAKELLASAGEAALEGLIEGAAEGAVEAILTGSEDFFGDVVESAAESAIEAALEDVGEQFASGEALESTPRYFSQQFGTEN